MHYGHQSDEIECRVSLQVDVTSELQDDQSRLIDQVIAEVSSSLCVTEPDDLSSRLEPALERLGVSTGVSRVTLVEYDLGESRTYAWTAATAAVDGEPADTTVT